jgi:hypothetical protein
MNLFPLIADRLERRPELLREAMAVLQRWRAERLGPERRMIEWEQLLRDAERGLEGFPRLLALLRDDSEAARRLKNFAPLAGLLTREERRKVILSCSYAH